MKAKYEYWLKLTKNIPYLYDELISIKDDEKQIEERFYRDLEFGTAGLRGILGAGTNRMNVFTVKRTAEGVSQYLAKTFQSPSVAMGYDSREKSDLFTRISAEVYAAHGIKVYLFDKLMPTPLVSYAVRKLHCSGGVMVTASHNPKQYNGYKVYNNQGCQIDADTASKIESCITAVTDYESIPSVPFEEGLKNKSIEYISETLYENYMQELLKLSLSDGSIDLKIVYTPLNGTGNLPVRDILKRIGAKNVTVVPEQELPDSNFTTCPYPNPESKAALQKAIELSDKIHADLVLATDPDADRVGIAVRHYGETVLLTGNETGILLTYYMLSRKQIQKTLPKRPVIIKSIVTTTMPEVIANKFGGICYDVFTGFKYIGEKIQEMEEEGEEKDLVLAFEESYGYLPCTFIRDKDAVSASMLIAEMADYYSGMGKDLVEVLQDLYEEFGYYKSITKAYEFKGIEGADLMRHIVQSFRVAPPKTIAKESIISSIDYSEGVKGMEKANVLEFTTESLKAIVRPSGTEPKLKIYIHTHGKDKNHCDSVAELAVADLEKIILA